MATCNPTELLAAGKCFDCLDEGLKQTIKLQLLCEIANGSGDSGITQLTGDVTAGPGSGSQAATIAARAVTFAKLQAISTSRVLGRLTAGSGDVEELTITGTGNVVFSASPTLTGTALADAITMSGRLINSVNGALSAPAVSFTGTPITGGTTTTTKPLVLIETAGATSSAWSTSGTMLGVNAPSGFTGNLLDVQLNGASKFAVSTTQMLAPDGTAAAPGISWVGDPDTGMYKEAGNRIAWSFGGTIKMFFDSARIQNQSGVASSPSYSFSANTGDGFYLITTGTRTGFAINGTRVASFASDALELGASGDAILRRAAAANIALGAADAAAPVAQTISVQNVAAGTTDTAGVTTTWRGSAGTGNAASGTLQFQLGTPTSSGTTQHAFSTGLTLANIGSAGVASHAATFAGTVRAAGYTVATLPAAGTAGRIAYVTDATAPTYRGALVGGGAVTCAVFDTGAAWVSV